MSGGGAAMIAVPVFLMMGMSFPLAVATQKISAVFWCPPAAYTYLKGRKVNWRFMILFAGIGLIGAYFGVDVLLGLNRRTLEIIVGILIVLLVVHAFFKKDFGMVEIKGYPRWRQLLTYPFAFMLGFYESFFGSGNGIAFAFTTYYTRGYDFMVMLGYYYAVATAWVLFAALLYFRHGYYDFHIMIFAIIGSTIGSIIGSRLGRYKGNQFIKTLFIIVGGILGIKLLIGI